MALPLSAPIFEVSQSIPQKKLSAYGVRNALLGQGTYGKVYKYIKGSQIYAVKTMKTGQDQLGDALREIGFMLRLNHPNVLNIIDVIVEPEKTHVVLPFAAKGTLLSSIKTGLDEKTKILYAYQLLCGVGYCLSRDVIHCDIKPANVLVFEDDTIKIADFGLAHAFTCEGSYPKDIAYTEDYRPLEIFFGGKYSDASDIWATACTIFEIFSTKGVRLFENDSGNVERMIFQYFKDPEDLWPGIKSLPDYKPARVSGTRTFRDKFTRSGIVSGDVQDMLVAMLQLNPAERVPIPTLLESPIFAGLGTKWYQDVPRVFTCEENLEMRTKYPDLEERGVGDIGVTSAVTPNMRRILFDWLADVKDEFHCLNKTLCLAYYLIDAYTAKHNVSRKDYQLLGTACFYIANYYWEALNVAVEDMIYISDYSHTTQQFTEMFIKVVKAISYDALIATAADYYYLYRTAYPEAVNDTARKLLPLVYFGSLPYHHYAKQLALSVFLVSCAFHDVQFKHTTKLDNDAIVIYQGLASEIEMGTSIERLGDTLRKQLIEKLKDADIKVL